MVFFKIIILLICCYSFDASISSFLSYYDNSLCNGGALLIVTRSNESQVVYGSNRSSCKKSVQCSNPTDVSCKNPISYLVSIQVYDDDDIDTFYSVINGVKSLKYPIGACVASSNYGKCYYKVERN